MQLLLFLVAEIVVGDFIGSIENEVASLHGRDPEKASLLGNNFVRLVVAVTGRKQWKCRKVRGTRSNVYSIHVAPARSRLDEVDPKLVWTNKWTPG